MSEVFVVAQPALGESIGECAVHGFREFTGFYEIFAESGDGTRVAMADDPFGQ